tara:strand:- start:1951 stop:2631 length:681 start_codon:yes stop_codon:yes gene_type:complete
MFWNQMTIDTMILLYIAGLFALILVCLYALIQSKANKLYTFIIIPLALVMASMTWQGIKLLQGMPIYGLPENQEVEVMWVNDNKPWIFAVLKIDSDPVLFKIDWSEENKKKMKELEKKIGSSLAQGKFKKTKSNKGESNSYFFTPMMDLSEPEEKKQRGGVEYQTTTPSQSSVLGFEGDPNVTRTGTEEDIGPSLERVVDGEAVIFDRRPSRDIYNGNQPLHTGGK